MQTILENVILYTGRKEEENMKQDKLLTVIEYSQKTVSIRASIHAQERMLERGIIERIIIGNIMILGEERMSELIDAQEDVILNDELNNISIVITFKKHTITVITVVETYKYYRNDKQTKVVDIYETKRKPKRKKRNKSKALQYKV